MGVPPPSTKRSGGGRPARGSLVLPTLLDRLLRLLLLRILRLLDALGHHDLLATRSAQLFKQHVTAPGAPVIRAAADPAYPQLPRVGQLLRNVRGRRARRPSHSRSSRRSPPWRSLRARRSFSRLVARKVSSSGLPPIPLRVRPHRRHRPAAVVERQGVARRGAGEVRGPGAGAAPVAEASEAAVPPRRMTSRRFGRLRRCCASTSRGRRSPPSPAPCRSRARVAERRRGRSARQPWRHGGMDATTELHRRAALIEAARWPTSMTRRGWPTPTRPPSRWSGPRSDACWRRSRIGSARLPERGGGEGNRHPVAQP